MEFHPGYVIGAVALILGFVVTLVATIKGAGLPILTTLGILDPRKIDLREDLAAARKLLRNS